METLPSSVHQAADGIVSPADPSRNRGPRGLTRSAPDATEPATATMAILSRYANLALNQQIEHAYGAALRARDLATAAAAIVARDCPPGPARDVLLGSLARQEAASERMMSAVLRFARAYGHLAFAFPFAADPLPASQASARSVRPRARRTPARGSAVTRAADATPDR